MEAAHRAAGDGDEAEGEDGPGEDRAGAVNEAGQRRHLDGRADEKDARGKRQDDADFDESTQVVARGQQKPHGQSRGCEAIKDDGGGERRSGERKDARPAGRFGHPLPGNQREKDEDEANGRSLEDAAGPPIAHVHAHEHGDGNRHRQGEGAPGRGLERVDDHQPHHGQQNDHDGQHGQQSDHAAAS